MSIKTEVLFNNTWNVRISDPLGDYLDPVSLGNLGVKIGNLGVKAE
ncbi:MAG: DUF5377 family protein [Haemophilus parainfluenzae]|nr:DUF5377 family protein [Haemophilus parainfluenzae]